MAEAEQGQSQGQDDWGPRRLVVLQATPWSRLAARTLDVHINAVAVLIVAVWLIPEFVARVFGLGDLGGLALRVALVPLALMIDATIFRVFDQSIGKAITGLVLKKRDGSRLKFGELIGRNAVIWVRGYGLGIPIVSLVAFIFSYLDLDTKGDAGWDRSVGTEVIQNDASMIRTGVAFILSGVLSVLLWIPGILDAVNPLLPISMGAISANKGLPTQVDGVTRLDSIKLAGRSTIEYSFTVIKPDGTTFPPSDIYESLNSPAFRQGLRKQFCQSADFAVYRKANIGARFVYSTADGREAAKMRFSNDDC